MAQEPEDLVIECSVCEKKLRVPASSKGKRFRCPGCKTILGHDADTPADTPDEAPPPARRRRKRKTGPAKTTPSKARKGEKTSRSRLPLLVGAAGLLLLLAVGGVLILSTPDADEGDVSQSEETSEEHAEEAAEKPAEKPVASAKKKTGNKRHAALMKKAQCALTPGEYKACGDEAHSLGLKGAAVLLWTWAVRKNLPSALEGALAEDDCKALYEKIGYRLYEIPADARTMAEEEGILEDLKTYNGRWLPPKDFERVKALEPAALSVARREFKLRQDDPVYAKTQVIKRKLRDAKGFKDYIFGHRYDDPYLVLDERGRKGGRLADEDDIEFLIEKKIGMLRQVFSYVKETWMDPLGIEQKNKEPMVAVQFAGYKSFMAYNRAIGLNIPPGAMAYFSRISTFIFMFDRESQDSEQRDRQDGILFHEATHQIVSAFLNEAGKSYRGSVGVSHWFNEGIAEYVGSVTRSENDEGERIWLFGALNPSRVNEFYRALHPGKFQSSRQLGVERPYALTLREMADCRHPMQVIQKVFSKFGRLDSTKMVAYRSIASSLVYAQASFFLHFCYCGPKKDDYGPRLHRYTAEEFKGRGGWTALCKAFKGVDMTTLEREWIEHLLSVTPERTRDGNLPRKKPGKGK